MRSRYTAFVLKNLEYVIATTDPQAVLGFDFESTREWMNDSEFLKLEVLSSSAEGNKGLVEFKAHFKPTVGELAGKTQIHHELSKFRRHQGRWYFRDGRLMSPPIPPA